MKVCNIIFSAIAAFCLFACKSEKQEECPPTTYQALQPSAKEWFPYTSNRILVFENGPLKDTLNLTNYFLGDDDIWNGDECPTSKGEFLRGNIVDKKSGDTIKVEIGNGEQVIIKKKSGYIFYYDTKKQLAQQNTYRRFESTINLNGKTYSSVLVFECAPEDKCTSASVTKFYFSKTKGLVAYERSGTTWTLK